MFGFSAIFVGMLIAIMITFNGMLDGYLGSYTSILIIHLVGIAAVIIILLCKREKLKLNGKMPIYLFSAGVIGVFMVFLNNLCFSKLGVALTLALGVFGQILLACFIDHFGWLGMKVYKFQKKKLMGFIIILIGIVVMTMY